MQSFSGERVDADRMTPARWQSVKAVLATALELGPDERARYLDHLGAGDRALAAEVERLLHADAMAGTQFLDRSPLLISDEPAEEADRWIGRRVGAYRLVERLGVGGMGVVYRATRVDQAYQRDVAIKLVREQPGSAFVTRVKTERQILADLDHPNIARLLDGGTAAGDVPYLVMELIVGTPLTEYCDRQALTIDDRLELFLTVCSAVDYAHQHLVVHRDIKPGNILVTADGVPKLLDFGIARMLGSPAGDAAAVTIAGPLAMTPAYASPEQLRGDAITTATDVYSLGLVLYELLTGCRAFEADATLPREMARVRLEREPDAPSAVVRRRSITRSAAFNAAASPDKLRRRLTGDLDTIVLKAIRNEPRERYGSVEQLSTDIRRHLEGRPIAARNGTLRYRAMKFLERNGVAVGVAATVAASMATAGAIAIRSATMVRAERVRAEQRVDDLRQLARSNLFELHDAIQALPGSAPARNLLIERTLQYLDHLNADGGGTRDLQQELAIGYERIAQLQGNFSGPGIGDSQAAIASYRKAMAIRDRLTAARPDDPLELAALGDLLTNYTVTLQMVSRTAEAAAVARRALSVCERVVLLRPADPRALADEAAAHARLASVVGGTGSSGSTREIASAIDHDRRALAVLASVPSDPTDTRVQRAVEDVQMHLGFHLSKARAFGESARVFDALLSGDRARPVLDAAHLLLVYNYRGLMYDRAGDHQAALADYERQLALATAAAASDPRDLQAKTNLAIAEANVGIDTARLGHPAIGLPKIEQATGIAEHLLASNPSQLFYADLLVVAYSYQAEILSALGDQAGAAAKYSAALRMAMRVSRADPQDLESTLNIAKIHAALAVVRSRARQYADAMEEVGAAREELALVHGVRPADAEAASVAASNRATAAALRSCVDGRPCAGVASLRLPCLVN